MVGPTLGLGLQASSTESMNFCQCKPPSWWSLVIGGPRTPAPCALGQGRWGTPASSMPGVWSVKLHFPDTDGHPCEPQLCPYAAPAPRPACRGDWGVQRPPPVSRKGGWASKDRGFYPCGGPVPSALVVGGNAHVHMSWVQSPLTSVLPSGEQRWLHSVMSQTIKACFFSKYHH